MAGFTVTSVTADQIEDPSENLIDAYTITFTVGAKTDKFTVQVPTAGDPVTAAAEAIQAVADEVGGIYAL